MGILAASSGAGILVFGLFAGAWADRLRRRPILIAADLARAALLGTIPLAAALHRLNMPHLYTVGTLAGILTVIFDVSYQAYLPSLVDVENIVEANSKLALTESIADITGPGLTGLLVQLITAPVAILLDALSFVCSAISVWLIRKPEPLPEPSLSPHIGREIAEGLDRLVAQSRAPRAAPTRGHRPVLSRLHRRPVLPLRARTPPHRRIAGHHRLGGRRQQPVGRSRWHSPCCAAGDPAAP